MTDVDPKFLKQWGISKTIVEGGSLCVVDGAGLVFLPDRGTGPATPTDKYHICAFEGPTEGKVVGMITRVYLDSTGQLSVVGCDEMDDGEWSGQLEEVRLSNPSAVVEMYPWEEPAEFKLRCEEVLNQAIRHWNTKHPEDPMSPVSGWDLTN